MLQIEVDTKFNWRTKSEKLRVDLHSYRVDSIVTEKRLYINIPDPSDHSGHLKGDVCFSILH